MQFVFLLFLLPKMTSILSRSLETGYDHYGVCVPKLVKYSKEELRMRNSNLGIK